MRNEGNGKHQTTATCPNCGGTITFDPDEDFMAKCPYCEQSFRVADLMHESEAEHVERMRARQEDKKRDFQREQMNFAREQQERQNSFTREQMDRWDQKERAQAFRVSRVRQFFTLCTVIAFALLALSIFMKNPGAIALSALICALYVVYFLMGYQQVKEPFHGFHNLLAIGALLLVIPYYYVGLAGSLWTLADLPVDLITQLETKTLDWNEVLLHDHLPEPSSMEASVEYNDGDSFSADFTGISEDEYTAYVDACKDMGYTLGQSTGGYGAEEHYRAKSADYYDLSLDYDRAWNTLDIALYAPDPITDITWPESGAGALVPVPEVSPLEGSVSSESTDYYIVTLVKVTEEEYNSYVSALQEAGFTKDYSKSQDSYSAKDSHDNEVSLSYDAGVQTMEISVYKDQGGLFF